MTAKKLSKKPRPRTRRTLRTKAKSSGIAAAPPPAQAPKPKKGFFAQAFANIAAIFAADPLDAPRED